VRKLSSPMFPTTRVSKVLQVTSSITSLFPPSLFGFFSPNPITLFSPSNLDGPSFSVEPGPCMRLRLASWSPVKSSHRLLFFCCLRKPPRAETVGSGCVSSESPYFLPLKTTLLPSFFKLKLKLTQQSLVQLLFLFFRWLFLQSSHLDGFNPPSRFYPLGGGPLKANVSLPSPSCPRSLSHLLSEPRSPVLSAL